MVEDVSNDAALRRHFYDTEVAHALMDFLADSEKAAVDQNYTNRVFQLLQRVMEFKKEGTYIPGETLQTEQQRIRVLQSGVVLMCLHLMKSAEANTSKLAKEHVSGCYTTRELEWVLQTMKKMSPEATPEEKRYFADCILLRLTFVLVKLTGYSPKQKSRFLQSSDVWEDKELILSEYC